MRILNFGSCNIDYVYSLEHIVKAGETEPTKRLEIFPGGKGLNQSIAAARAGGEVYHAGCIGFDGEFLTETLMKSGVDVSFIKKSDVKNGHAIIQVDKMGENSIFLYSGSNFMIDSEFIDSVLNNFSENDILMLQNEINNIDYIIEKAYSKNMHIVLNPSPFNEKTAKLDFNKISYLILNETEAKEISGSSVPEEAMAYFSEKYPQLKVVLTLGSRGCVYFDENLSLYQPAFEVKAVDTTAAGDTFTGYFVVGISKKMSYKEILKIASCASAVSVSKNGASPSIPGFSEVLEKLSVLKTKKDGKSCQALEKINKYISENLTNPLLGELSEILGYSSVYTGNIVKKLTGKSFTRLISEQRCEKAAELLKKTNLPVSEIINSVGYTNESFFRRSFKEIYGKLPLEYRRDYN